MRVVTQPGGLARRGGQRAAGGGVRVRQRHRVHRAVVDSPRHIEVQIFGDTQGTVVHLFERECSIQRRYQKIIEEAPLARRRRRAARGPGPAAVAAAKAIGYVGAGTVEFVLDPAGRFFFLEVNTRLQVEHPVTELVTGLDLVALQLQVAEGEPLPAEVRRPRSPGTRSKPGCTPRTWPRASCPPAGTLRAFDIPAGAGVRVDAGVAAGRPVGRYYDAMLAKVIAWAPTRDAARPPGPLRWPSAVHGVVTNRDLLVGDPPRAGVPGGQIDTGFLDRHPRRGSAGRAAAGPGARARRRPGRPGRAPGYAPGAASIPSGWRNVPARPQHVTFDLGGRPDRRPLPVHRNRPHRGGQRRAGHRPGPAPATPGRVIADIDGIRREIAVRQSGGIWDVTATWAAPS